MLSSLLGWRVSLQGPKDRFHAHQRVDSAGRGCTALPAGPFKQVLLPTGEEPGHMAQMQPKAQEDRAARAPSLLGGSSIRFEN